MSTASARLTIPMDKALRAKLAKSSEDLGFDSPQALLRYVSKAIVDSRDVTFGIDYGAPRDKDGWDDWGPVPDDVLKRWDEQIAKYEADRKAGKVKSFDTAEAALKYLHADAKKRNRI